MNEPGALCLGIAIGWQIIARIFSREKALLKEMELLNKKLLICKQDKQKADRELEAVELARDVHYQNWIKVVEKLNGRKHE